MFSKHKPSILFFKLLKDIEINMEQPSPERELALNKVIENNISDLISWVCEDIEKRDVILIYMLERDFTSRYPLLSKNLVILKQLIKFDNPEYLETLLSLEDKNDKKYLQNLFELAVKTNSPRLIVHYFLNFDLITLDFELAKKVAPLVAVINNPEIKENFAKKINHLSEEEKQELEEEYFLPFTTNIDIFLQSTTLANAHSNLLSIYKQASQDLHKSTIIWQAASIYIEMRKGTFQLSMNQLEKFGQWRRYLAIRNKTAPISAFANVRTEVGTATQAKGPYQPLLLIAQKISPEDAEYFHSDQSLNKQSGINFITVLYKHSEEEKIPLSRLKIDYDEPEKSYIEHTNPKVFNKLINVINTNIKDTLEFPLDINNEDSILALTKKIGKIHWLLSQATFFKRGSETTNDAIINALFIYHGLYIKGFKDIPYLHAYATPNIETYQHLYPSFLKEVPQPIPTETLKPLFNNNFSLKKSK